MAYPLQLDRANNAYFVVTLSKSGWAFSSPASLAELHPSLHYLGQVGELDDTHVYCAALDQGNAILGFLNGRKNGQEGIVRVDVPEERELEKRAFRRQRV
ncbi:hypothetical protein FA15DRAFT_619084 [Coprinopsis marcescibilis]|uniref:Uncharacterized protein n=1 Tax=Coprinopsis marcescibilis TaxID=230819 RepID=A0A5C3KVT5_COPMA|nr:hypothetical protein FA15DRAFT_619084 [Coprinopsis marcescibilis]